MKTFEEEVKKIFRNKVKDIVPRKEITKVEAQIFSRKVASTFRLKKKEARKLLELYKP